MKRKQFKRIGTVCLAACLVLSLLAGCFGQAGSTPTEGSNPADPTGHTANSAAYTVTVTTEAGAALEGIAVYIYEDETAQELVAFEKTDAQGAICFTAPESSAYVAVLQGVKPGYSVEAQYAVTADTRIVLPIELPAEDLAQQSFKLGDVMCDFTVTDIQGNTYKLSELLEKKQAVVLNFWFAGCTPCKSEFPYLQEAYEQYADKLEVLAMDPLDTETDEVKAFVQELELTMPVVQCDPAWEKAMGIVGYPTTVVIDSNGIVSLVHTNALTSTENFADIFAHFTAESYTGEPVEDVQDLLVTQPEEAPISNPESVGGVTSFQLTVRPGETVYCDLYRVDGMYLQTSATDAYITCMGSTYTPQNGVIGLNLYTPDIRTPVQIGICNQGDKTTTYTFNLYAAYGSLNNPIPLKLGQFNTTVYAGNDEGVYYRYTATQDGYLVLRCLDVTVGVPYDFVLYNLNTYANRTLEVDAEVDEQGQYLKIRVNKGNVVQFSANTLPNDNGVYPGAEFTFEASLLDQAEGDAANASTKLYYALTVTDGQRQPISGVQVYFTGAEVNQTAVTNDKGVAYVKLEKGDYTATVKLPQGYEAKTTEFALTEACPTLAVKLDKLNIVTHTYTVTVVDEQNAPMADVVVLVGDRSGATDGTGVASFELPEGDYTATVSAPAGYRAEQTAYSFGDATAVTVKLLKVSDTDQPGEDEATYTVTVVDHFGAPIANVPVSFLAQGTSVGVAVTDSQGVATAVLAKGTYTLQLPAAAYHHAGASVTEETPTATLTATAKVDKSAANTESLYTGDAYYISTGATYIDGMQTNVANYYLFRPTTEGIYRVTTTDPAAQVSFWGANVNYIIDHTGDDSIGFADNAYTLEIRQENMGDGIAWIIGITGSPEATLLITRTGDIQRSEEELAEWIVFTGTETPPDGTKFVPSETGTLTFVDLTGSTAANTPVKGDDGYYHLGSKTGPILYAKLGPTGYRYVSFYNLMGNEQGGGMRFCRVFYEGDRFIKKEVYNDCLKAYTLAFPETGPGVYPLTDDLIYMLQNGGTYMGWWDETNPNYLFGETANLNTEIAWMFNVCYYQ